MPRKASIASPTKPSQTAIQSPITPRLVTIKQGAAYCSCSVWAIRQVIWSKELRACKIGKSWGITVELAASSKEPPSLMITLEGKWRVYKARLEGHLLNGTYSFTEDRFSGSQISPWVDLRGEEPGPLWELVPEPPAEIPPGVGILFRHGGDLRQSLIDHFAERKVRELT